jgi:hypothetical protein
VRVAAAAAATVISFNGKEGSGDVSIALGADIRVTEGLVTYRRAELILDGVPIEMKLERKLDVLKFGSPVRSIDVHRDARVPNRVYVVVDLLAPATPTVQRGSGRIQWHFEGNDMAYVNSSERAPGSCITANVALYAMNSHGSVT